MRYFVGPKCKVLTLTITLVLLTQRVSSTSFASVLCNGVLYVGSYSATTLTSVTYDEAEAYCESVGGWLPTINSSATNAVVLAAASGLGSANAFIGGSRRSSDSTDGQRYRWVTGPPNENNFGQYFFSGLTSATGICYPGKFCNFDVNAPAGGDVLQLVVPTGAWIDVTAATETTTVVCALPSNALQKTCSRSHTPSTSIPSVSRTTTVATTSTQTASKSRRSLTLSRTDDRSMSLLSYSMSQSVYQSNSWTTNSQRNSFSHSHSISATASRSLLSVTPSMTRTHGSGSSSATHSSSLSPTFSKSRSRGSETFSPSTTGSQTKASLSPIVTQSLTWSLSSESTITFLSPTMSLTVSFLASASQTRTGELSQSPTISRSERSLTSSPTSSHSSSPSRSVSTSSSPSISTSRTSSNLRSSSFSSEFPTLSFSSSMTSTSEKSTTETYHDTSSLSVSFTNVGSTSETFPARSESLSRSASSEISDTAVTGTVTYTRGDVTLTSSHTVTSDSTLSHSKNETPSRTFTGSTTRSDTTYFVAYSLGTAWELALLWFKSMANDCMILNIAIGSPCVGILVIASAVAVLLSCARCQIIIDTHVDVPTWRSLFILHAYLGAIWPCHFRCAPLHALILLLHVNLLTLVLATICYSLTLKTAPEAAIAVVCSVISCTAPQPLINVIMFYFQFDPRDEKHRTLCVVRCDTGDKQLQEDIHGVSNPAEQHVTVTADVDESFVFEFGDEMNNNNTTRKKVPGDSDTPFPASSDRSTPSTEPDDEAVTSRSEWMPITTHAMWTALALVILIAMTVVGTVSLTAALDAAGKCEPGASGSFQTLLWVAVLIDVMLGQSLYLGGVYFFRTMVSDDTDHVWRELHPYNGEWRLCSDKAPPTNRELALSRLAQDWDDCRAWCMLGRTMSHQETLTIPTNSLVVSRRDCYANALRADASSARAWKGMGQCLWHGEFIDVEGEAWVRSSCYAQALELRPDDAELWFLLGNALTVTEAVQISGKVRTAQDCYTESLRRNISLSMAWNNLGATMSVTSMADIGGRCMTKRMCFIEAIKTAPNNVLAWNNLASSLGRDEKAQLADKTVVSKRDACVFALGHDSCSSAAWNKLGTTLGPNEVIAIHGRRWTRVDCFSQALRISPKFAAAWTNLGTALSKADVVTVNGKSYTRQQCFVEALRCCPCYSSAWDNLGWTMEPSDPPVDVNGALFSRAACFIRVVETAEAFQELNCDEARGS